MQVQETIKSRLWTKNFLLLLFSNLTVFFAFQILLPTMPKYIVQLGGNDTSVGLIIGIFTISAVLIRFWLGRELDRRGRKPILIYGLVIFIGTSLLYNLASVVWLLLAFRIVHGIGWGGSTTAAGTVASDIVPPDRRGEGMGYFGLTNNLSMSVGPALGIAVMNSLGFKYLFTFSAIIATISLVFALLIDYPPVREGNSSRSKLVDKGTLWPGLVMFFVAISFGGIISFITLLGLEKGIENVGMFFTVFAVVLVLTRPLAGILTDRKGPEWAVLPGMILLISGLFTLSLTNGMTVLLLAGAFYGGGFGAVQPVMQTLIIDIASPEQRGSANASFFNAMDLGIGIGAMILGLIAQLTSYMMMYRIAILFVIPGLIIYIARYRHFHDARMQSRSH